MKNFMILLMLPILLWGSEAIVVGKPTVVVGKRVQALYNGDEIPKITMDLDVLRNAKYFKDKQPIVIEIDDNLSFTFVPKRFEVRGKKGDFSWVGQSEDGKAKAILSVRNGVMFGTLTCEDSKYKIYPQNGHFEVIKVDPSMVLPFHDDTVMEPERKMMPTPQPQVEQQTQEESVEANETSSNEPQESSDTVQASEASVTDSVVTLLVYYTQALEDKYGANTEAMIQANLDLAKDAYIDSDTEINLQVVLLKKVPASSLLSTADSEDLNDLLDKLSTDGLVRYEREHYGADAVTVFSKYPESGGCGLGRSSYDPNSSLVGAYSSVHIKPVPVGGGTYCSDLSFAHELGHNFGCQHDASNAGNAMYAYAYGYDVINKFGTIMSYDGPEISYFSNPRMTHTDGTAIGNVSNADNARTIKENQHKMADNSEQISEALESGDSDNEVDYTVSGNLNSAADRDGYVMWLEGTTTLDKSYQGFYMNIYNEDTHTHIVSSSNDITRTFTKGRYRVVVAMSNDDTGYYYSGENTSYSIGITTEYIPPVSSPVMPAIINYLLN